MNSSDAQMTSFWIPLGNVCYTDMQFGFKNAGATFQLAMTVVFHDMLQDFLEDCLDDFIGKSKQELHHINDLRKVFTRRKQYNL